MRHLPIPLRPLLAALVLSTVAANAQDEIENVIVETYYVSDANDAVPTVGGTLPAGSRTYRVFLDLCEGCALRSVYADANHVLRIASTAPFFNHEDRGRTYGHQVTNGGLNENTAALDSWLSLGRASNQRLGIPKADDPDGSTLGGPNNDMGMLANADPLAGFPLTERDGLVPLAGQPVVPPNFLAQGDDPGEVFFETTVAAEFVTNDFKMSCSLPGVTGPTADNRILIAQLTTTGELTFALNVEVQRPDGNVVKLVSPDTPALPGETTNGLLVYPPDCGCMDPFFLEYDPAAGCDDGSCATPIVFGCMDPEACNYDPLANFNIPQLCCYGPGNCNGLDVQLICPGAGIAEEAEAALGIMLSPNPAHTESMLRITAPQAQALQLMLFDATGRLVWEGREVIPSGASTIVLDLRHLQQGAYRLWLLAGAHAFHRTLIKH